MAMEIGGEVVMEDAVKPFAVFILYFFHAAVIQRFKAEPALS